MEGRYDVYMKAGDPEVERQILALPQKERWAALMELESVQEAHCKNLLRDNLAAFMFNKVMQGANQEEPYWRDSGSSYFSFMNLSVDGTDPTYNADSTLWSTADIAVVPNSTGVAASSKRFWLDRVQDPVTRSLTDGREGIESIWRWLWRTFDANTAINGIKSLSPWFSENADATGGGFNRAIAGRVRLKDSQGRNLELIKQANRMLAVQYTITWLSV